MRCHSVHTQQRQQPRRHKLRQQPRPHKLRQRQTGQIRRYVAGTGAAGGAVVSTAVKTVLPQRSSRAPQLHQRLAVRRRLRPPPRVYSWLTRPVLKKRRHQLQPQRHRLPRRQVRQQPRQRQAQCQPQRLPRQH